MYFSLVNISANPPRFGGESKSTGVSCTNLLFQWTLGASRWLIPGLGGMPKLGLTLICQLFMHMSFNSLQMPKAKKKVRSAVGEELSPRIRKRPSRLVEEDLETPTGSSAGPETPQAGDDIPDVTAAGESSLGMTLGTVQEADQLSQFRNSLLSTVDEKLAQFTDLVKNSLMNRGQSGIGTGLGLLPNQPQDSTTGSGIPPNQTQNSATGSGLPPNQTQDSSTISGAVAAALQGLGTATVEISDTFKLMGARVSDKLKGLIWAHEYIDLAGLLTPEASEMFQVKMVQGELGSTLSFVPQQQKRSFLTIQQWDSAFAIYMSVYLQRYPLQVADLLQYSQQIKSMAANSARWWQYDENFRRHRAQTQISWASTLLDKFLQAYVGVTSPKVNQSGSFQEKKGKNGQSNSQTFRKKFKKGLCFRFNQGLICSSGCRFDHSCDTCGGAHGVYACSKENNRLSKPNWDSPRLSGNYNQTNYGRNQSFRK
jgi:hypothetical protein